MVPNKKRPTLHGFIEQHVPPGPKVYTDEAAAHQKMPYDHEALNHSVGEYVRGMAHTNGIESSWAQLKRASHGTYHHISPKHLHRYINEFAARHKHRDLDTEAMMAELATAMIGKCQTHRQLIGKT